MNHLEEVKTLAKLNHTNIVPYKQAWIEPMSLPCIPQLPSTSRPVSVNNKLTSKTSSKMRKVSESKSFSYTSQKNQKSYQFLSEQYNCNSELSKSDIVIFKEDEVCGVSVESETSNIEEISSRSKTEESISSDESLEDFKICQYSTQSNQYSILYIQMALCEKTLRQWLDERIEPTALSIVASITSQILCGLNYIHSLKIVHHDIKPSNIFISTSGKLQVQLGDFGLACPLQRNSHDAIVGTSLYAAPEQLQGECNPKSDIYSLGIVLLELLIPMQTTMECIKMVETLKTGETPKVLPASYSKWVNTIKELIQKNPSRRPSTDELLQDLKVDKDLTITRLQNENDKLQIENDELRNENNKKDQIILDQKMKIEELLAQISEIQMKKDFIQ